jgi:peptidoglycan L-alanyl-D-glutamate endopeptidase CwlK
MKLKLVTTDKTLLKWRTLDAKKREILAALNSGKNANFTDFDIELQADLKPEVTDKKRISHKWLDTITTPFFKLGYDFVGLHMSMAQWKKFGIQASLNGANPIDTDVLGEFYVRADETTKRKGTRYLQFIQTLLHEICHEYFRGAGLPDITHEYHDKHKDIRGLLATLDWALYRPKLQEMRGLEAILKKKLSEYITYLQEKVKALTAKQVPYVPTAVMPLVQRKADAVVAEMAARGHAVRMVEGYRSIERQNELYAQGRTTAGAVVTNAKGGQSFHNYGVAVDFVFRKEGYNASDTLWALLGKVGKLQGFEWGGDWQGFVDRPHFELKLGYTLKDFQDQKVDYKKYN